MIKCIPGQGNQTTTDLSVSLRMIRQLLIARALLCCALRQEPCSTILQPEYNETELEKGDSTKRFIEYLPCKIQGLGIE